MSTRHSARRRALVWAIAFALSPVCASAQGEPWPVLWDVARSVAVDPTTYAPATLAFTAQRLDWKSSQVFFEHGWMEQNPSFTITGRTNDIPLSYSAGVSVIRSNALSIFGGSVVNNVAAGLSERLLTARYPKQRRLWRTLSWVERVSFAAYVGYVSSADHFRQIGRNRRLAQQYGY